MLLNPLTIHTPKTLDEALSLYSRLTNVRLQAGGTFLLNSLKLLKRKGTKTPEHVISLRKITELKGLMADEEKLVIKSMTVINEIFDSPFLKDNFQVLRTVCRNISTNPIRNMATMGGNLTCRYTWTEMPAVMVALEADLHFVGKDGQNHIISAEEFFQNAAKTDKILKEVVIKRDAKASIIYRRLKKSPYVDIPLLSICLKTYREENRLQNTRVAVNNCVAFAQRDRVLENFLNETSISEKLPEEALDHLDNKIYDTRSDDYKKHMFRVSIKSAIKEIVSSRK